MGLIEDLSESSGIIKDISYLDPRRCITPEDGDLLIRKKQALEMINPFKPLIKGGEPYLDLQILEGGPGSGKTQTVLYASREVEKKFPSVIFPKIGLEHETANKMASAVYNILTQKKDIRRLKRISTSDIFEDIFRIIEENEIYLQIVLDDANRLNYKEIARFVGPIIKKENCPNLGLTILIDDTNKLLRKIKGFDESSYVSLKSSLWGKEIYFDVYSEEEVYSIIEQRAKLSLYPGTYRGEALKRIAEFTTDIDLGMHRGDIRYAINLLRSACELAERREEDCISEEDIKISRDVAMRYVWRNDIKRLTLREKIILLSVVSSMENERMTISEEVKIYEAIVNLYLKEFDISPEIRDKLTVGRKTIERENAVLDRMNCIDMGRKEVGSKGGRPAYIINTIVPPGVIKGTLEKELGFEISVRRDMNVLSDRRMIKMRKLE
ncbi:MAG: hypothetical protein EF807_01265 [Candidatus Methanolliviera hydrocarbonicum]|uniref:Cdc6 AAA+ ATPase-type lid domain-containing protein n=1 Tax=Candidatus Methanolliviera hydrocarbonicum TaxID=2491085 RepID=A0A520KYG4_9EURY|nr:MAG: hypothetical protein EF807_01265 [Candidatus Methanolliviera hydrocarbonicum]